MLPAIATALVISGMACALVLNRLYIDSARAELDLCVDSAALAAAAHLATDDLLRIDRQDSKRISDAESAAAAMAAENLVAGDGLHLQTGPEGDIRCGRLVADSKNSYTFLETTHDPRSILVSGYRERSRNNPLDLFYTGVSGQHTADLYSQAVATLDNQVVGCRPGSNFAAPLLPLGILLADPTGSVPDTWENVIVKRLGPDVFKYDAQSHQIVPGPDGLVELGLHGPSDDELGNVVLCDLGNGLGVDGLVRQIKTGVTSDDLKSHQREIRVSVAKPLRLRSSFLFTNDIYSALLGQHGECRIVLLYAQGADPTSVQCVGLAAGRVMAVVSTGTKPPRIMFQAGVIVTRTALVRGDVSTSESAHAGGPGADASAADTENAYIHKLILTH